MNLIIDIGNSVAKLAIFDKGELVEVFRGSNHSLDCLPMLCSRYPLKRGIIASVITLSNTIRHQLERLPFNIIELSHETPVPVTNLYYVIRTLLRGRGSNIIKVISLGLGLTMSILLFSRVAFEQSYDTFYKDYDNLYQIFSIFSADGFVI